MNELRAVMVFAAGVWMFTAAADDPTAEEILSGNVPPLDYSQSVKCLASYKIERMEALNERYIVFHMRGDELWLAQLRGRCPGVSADATLSFEKDTNRLCEWDTVRVVRDDRLGGDIKLGPRCNLPKFDQVSMEQVEMLKQQIRTARRLPAEPKP